MGVLDDMAEAGSGVGDDVRRCAQCVQHVKIDDGVMAVDKNFFLYPSDFRAFSIEIVPDVPCIPWCVSPGFKVPAPHGRRMLLRDVPNR